MMERLQRILSANGIASRRASEQLIVDGRVRVNGTIVRELGSRADPTVDRIEVDGRPLVQPRLRYIMLNKPPGYITTVSDERDRRTVMDLVETNERIYPVGRLDRETEGLLLLTNDGDLAHRLAHPSHGVDKEYLAEVEGHPGGGAVRRLRDGVELEDGMTAPAKVSQPSPGVLRITIHEGRNRQVRRMCEAVGHPVTRLIRVRIGPLRDATLAPGEWRELTLAEVRSLVEAASGSTRPVR